MYNAPFVVRGICNYEHSGVDHVEYLETRCWLLLWGWSMSIGDPF